ncbi:hypothetical protein P3T76_015669 [Phytophthora citrophthora]|uniref:Uncharacterized protein n=1 Tax=Phytophthora citrophthora TaxID=4793 RepID=A0AAD9LA20_9STRA|nr:hypothetical protein P3T76_015669 [Phytophthora citrophthora]
MVAAAAISETVAEGADYGDAATVARTSMGPRVVATTARRHRRPPPNARRSAPKVTNRMDSPPAAAPER